jgi:translation initiation factor 5B
MPKKQSGKDAINLDDILSEFSDITPIKETNTNDVPELTKAQKKRLKKKEGGNENDEDKSTVVNNSLSNNTPSNNTPSSSTPSNTQTNTPVKKESKFVSALKEKIKNQKDAEERRLKEEDEKKRVELETQRLEEEMQKEAEIKRQHRIEERKKRREDMRRQGILVSSKQKERNEKNKIFVQQLLNIQNNANNTNPIQIAENPDLNNDSDLNSESDSDSDSEKKTYELRSPISCILGHVDTGKTKLLDKIRRTNVQKNEAGGITQQIGATQFSISTIKKITHDIRSKQPAFPDINIPGLLIIDTPGHESFANMRLRGSNIADIVILVIDLMVGLEKQTLESLKLLQNKKTPFVVALNKIDRLYDWKPILDSDFKTTYDSQLDHTKEHFEKQFAHTKLQLAEEGFNAELYFKNDNSIESDSDYINIIPTSAITGEGIPDLLLFLTTYSQTKLYQKLVPCDDLDCRVLEVRPIEGYGATIDVIIINGTLSSSDTIVACGLDKPIVTPIRALLTPPLNSEIRIKQTDYTINEFVTGAIGVKIAAPNLESIVPGTKLLVYKPGSDIEELKENVQAELQTIMTNIDKTGKGVYLQASSLGSIEAMIAYLSTMTPPIPISNISIGTVHKKDIMRTSIIKEHYPEYGIILAFDVDIDPEAMLIANNNGVKIFTADIIYHLFDMASKYILDIKEQNKKNVSNNVVFPVALNIIKIFNANPLVIGCKVVDGTLRMNTRLCIPTKNNLYIGKVVSIQRNHTDIESAEKNSEVAIKIVDESIQHSIVPGRHFESTDQIVSHLTRTSIDLLKEHYKDDLVQSDWALIVKLKKILKIA